MKNLLKLFGIAEAILLVIGMMGCNQKQQEKSKKVFYRVTITQPDTSEGTLTANPQIPAGGKVLENTVITFTAKPNNETFMVDKWSITGSNVTSGG